jgi:hypothetical protein
MAEVLGPLTAQPARSPAKAQDALGPLPHRCELVGGKREESGQQYHGPGAGVPARCW